MIDETALINAIYEQQSEDDKAYKLMYFADNCREIYRAKNPQEIKLLKLLKI